MDSVKHTKIKPLEDDSIKVGFSQDTLKDVSSHIKVLYISEIGIDIECPEAEKLFEIGTVLEKIVIDLSGIGQCIVSGMIRFTNGNKCNIEFKGLDPDNLRKIDDYIRRTEKIEYLHLKTYKSIPEIERELQIKPHEEPPRIAEKRSRKRILIVDDSIAVQEKFRTILSSNNFEVVQALDGLEGIKKSLEKMPDLILMDVNMPRLNGLESARVIKSNAKTKGIPVCMFTSEDDKDTIMRAIRIGVKDYIIKSMDGEEVIKRVNRILNTC